MKTSVFYAVRVPPHHDGEPCVSADAHEELQRQYHLLIADVRHYKNELARAQRRLYDVDEQNRKLRDQVERLKPDFPALIAAIRA